MIVDTYEERKDKKIGLFTKAVQFADTHPDRRGKYPVGCKYHKGIQ